MIAEAELRKGASDAQNLVSLFEAQARRRGDATAVKFKSGGAWRDVSWAEMARRARDVSDGLASLGLRAGDRVAIIGDTNLEWILADLGILGAGGITVTIYQSNTPLECQYILADSGARFVFCDSAAQVAKIREVRGKLPALEGLVRAQGPAADAFERTLADVERAGVAWRASNPDAHAARLARIGRDDPASFIYTSGTTGNPKGVVLTHGNWVYEALAVEGLKVVRPDDLILMFLPMAHSFAKVIEAVWFSTGATGAFVESLEKIVDNAGEVRPTVMPSVPRIFEKAYNTVITKGLATPGLKGKLFKLALEEFEKYAAAKEQGKDYSSLGLTIGRKLVFPKLSATLSERFGGRMRLFVSGGAPLSPKIAHFFDQLGFVILEGYGLTETSAGTFVNRPGANRIGTVGPPVPGTEVRIAEDGEIMVRGPCVMKEYYNNPAATAEVLKDGWLATGDIGFVDEAGCLKITDRKKDIIVTAGGKNVAPQNLENELKTDPLVSQVMVHGDKRKFLSALITLNEENARKWASEHGLPAGEGLHRDPRLRARIQESIDALNARQASYATIKKFEILPRDFTQATGELTPTLKVKRKVVTQQYQALLDSFYAE
ncbi:long-chain fatty acid--CoA ligase [Anaeromyxobacter sp. PSR-1]|uniref:AMP-dependent synthetase/ligase n=1 Tax=Anaeromyxobacter sp. PSR-1 TaxID=1300915 RepID=UPI0005E66195|nr:long-chain fatty acid--CoA ligase [Anaeromyxobacter sp. PSR-1]GAO01243.1 long-chain-fatty-acid--CoA ligase FadD15 [Anaeromyxobacter sp. PSR-1]